MDAKANEGPADTKQSPEASEGTTRDASPLSNPEPIVAALPKRRWLRLGLHGWPRPSRRVMLWSLAALAVAGGSAASWWYSCGFVGCPSTAQLQAWHPTEGGALLDVNGSLIAPLAPVKRVNVPITRIPRHVQAAFVAVEDKRFYTHHGIDWRGVARAAVQNLRAGGVREGGSTITMQLARNVFLSHRANERSIPRKLLEWRYATLIERALDKPTILERYLNAIYLGNGVYGVEGASQDLFGKSVQNVTFAEAALLAGLPKAPSSYTPRNDPVRAHERRAVVLDVLEREQVATPQVIAAARVTPIRALPAEWQPSRRSDSWAVEMVRSVLDSLRRTGVIPSTLNDGQLRVRSTFDRRAQFAAERAIAGGTSQLDAARGEWGDGASRTQGTLVALDPSTGAIRALVGGRRIERKGFNRALRAHRQPGSAFKPFVYVTALQHGFTNASMVDDEPITIDNGRDEWTPANFNDDYAGRVTLRDALAHSANAATVRVSRSIGIAPIIEQAHALGITSPLPSVPALALGAGAVTPLELTTAYVPFGNGGLRVQPYTVERVEDIFGRVLWAHVASATPRVLDARDAFLVTSLMRSVVDEGTGRAVRAAGIRGPVAGKTGTTNDGTDVWFVGFTPTLVASVWFGADEPTPLGSDASGGRLAAPVWARFLREGWHSPEQDVAWAPPSGVVATSIDVATGKLASNFCGESRREWFRQGTAPTESCESETRIAMLDELLRPEPPQAPEPPVFTPPPARARQRPPQNRPQASPQYRPPTRTRNAQVRTLSHLVDRAINAINDRRGREVARRVMDELRRAAESDNRQHD